MSERKYFQKGFTQLEKFAKFIQRSLFYKAGKGLMPSSVNTVRRHSSLTGFTVLEVFIVVAIVFLLAVSWGAVHALRARKVAEQNICLEQRRAIEHAEIVYWAQTGKHTANLQDLVNSAYLPLLPECPSKGIITWLLYPEDSNNYQAILVCSVHGVAD